MTVVARPWPAPPPARVGTGATRHPLRRSLSRTGRNGVAVGFVTLMIFPVYWMVITAFKPRGEVMAPDPSFLPLHPTLAGFADAVHKQYFWDYWVNTVTVSVATVVISLAIGLLAAVALSRFDFVGRKLYLVVLLAIEAVPQASLIIPLYFTLKRFHQLDQLSGLTATYVIFTLPFAVWMLRGFVQSSPKDLEEAAMVDGCSRMGAFRRVLLPLIAPGMVATAVFSFIGAWNQYVFPFVFMQENNRYPLTVWLQSFSTDIGTDYSGLMAASVLYTLPVVVMFVVVQRKLVAGLASGALKG